MNSKLQKSTCFYLSLLITVLVISLLVTGSSMLNLSIGGIPLGTFITWSGMICLPLSIYLGISALRAPTTMISRILSLFLKLLLISGILWLPIAYLLAGNLSFTFSEKATFQGGQAAMRWFWRLSYGIGIGSLITLLLFWVSKLFEPLFKRGSKK